MFAFFQSGVSQASKLDHLQNASPLGAYLSEDELVALAKLCTSCSVKVGKALPESPFYIVIRGEVQVIEDDEVLCTKYPGAFFTRRAGLIARKQTLMNPVLSRRAKELERKSIVQNTKDDDGEGPPPSTNIVCKVRGGLRHANIGTQWWQRCSHCSSPQRRQSEQRVVPTARRS